MFALSTENEDSLANSFAGLVLPSMPAAVEKPSGLISPPETPQISFSAAHAHAHAHASSAKGKTLGKRTEPGEKIAKPSRQVRTLSAASAPQHPNISQDKSTSKLASAAKKPEQRYRCRYGCRHTTRKAVEGVEGARIDVPGFTATNLRKHMKRWHRVYTQREVDADILVKCQWCGLLLDKTDQEFSCNKGFPCPREPSVKQKMAASVPWPVTEQEFADTFAYAQGK